MSLSKRLITTDAAGGADGSANFAPVIWTGTGAAQSTNSLNSQSGTINFAPDLIWIKQRSGTRDHIIADTVRGPSTNFNLLYPYGDFAESTSVGSEFIRSMQSNGFTIGNHVYVSELNETYVAWCWKAGGAAVSNTDGDITSQVSANQAAGFSIVTHTSNNTNETIGHGLSAAPELIISKNRSVSGGWGVYNAISGTGKYLYFNLPNPIDTSATVYPTVNSTVFAGGSGGWNFGSHNYVHYCFHSVAGYQKVGSYTGDGSSNKSYVINVGFQPRFVMIKNTQSTGTSWVIADSLRGFNDLYANLTDAEFSSSDLYGAHFTSVGFTFNTADVSRNKLNEVYIYLAIA
tara:strand:- start:973 stop:2010 length:1038 start_codon:yes stop_codon:yes gene_type:complete